MVGEAYPKREGSHFAHRVLRLLVKTAAAQEIGPTAVALVMTVAMTEDAARYRRAVTFYNDQLLPLVGVAKWDALDRARRKAVEAGWLHYEARGSRRPGIYWVTIPATADGLADGPVDEGSAVPEIPENGAQLEDRKPSITPENGAHTETMVSVSGGNEGDDAGVIGGMKRGQWGGTSIPISYSLNPNPKENPPTPLCSLEDSADPFDARLADWTEFLNSYPPNSDGVKLGQERAQAVFCSLAPAERRRCIEAGGRYAVSEIAAVGKVTRMDRWLESGDWRAYLQKSTGPPRRKLVGGVDLDNLNLSEP